MLFSSQPKPMHQIRFGDNRKRVLLYCASDVGLGHFGNISRIGQYLHQNHPELQILFLTDNIPEASNNFTENFGIVKMPGYAHSKKYPDESGFKVEHDVLFQMRQNLIMTTIQSFQPDLFLMESGPHGKKNELEKPLRFLQKNFPDCWRIMHNRDIPIPPDEFWEEKRPYKKKMETQHDLYDFILISGSSKLFDIVKEYQWEGDLTQKLFYAGLLIPDVKNVETDPKKLLVSFGGGWDSEILGPVFCQVIPRIIKQTDYSVHLISGPSITNEDFAALKNLEQQHDRVQIDKFRQDFPEIVESAAACFLQAGLSVYQILNSDKPVVLYTRDYTTKEQEVRTDCVKKFPDIQIINKDDLDIEGMTERLVGVLDQKKQTRETGIRTEGLKCIGEVLAQTLKEKKKDSAPESVKKIISEIGET